MPLGLAEPLCTSTLPGPVLFLGPLPDAHLLRMGILSLVNLLGAALRDLRF